MESLKESRFTSFFNEFFLLSRRRARARSAGAPPLGVLTVKPVLPWAWRVRDASCSWAAASFISFFGGFIYFIFVEFRGSERVRGFNETAAVIFIIFCSWYGKTYLHLAAVGLSIFYFSHFKYCTDIFFLRENCYFCYIINYLVFFLFRIWGLKRNVILYQAALFYYWCN